MAYQEFKGFSSGIKAVWMDFPALAERITADGWMITGLIGDTVYAVHMGSKTPDEIFDATAAGNPVCWMQFLARLQPESDSADVLPSIRVASTDGTKFKVGPIAGFTLGWETRGDEVLFCVEPLSEEPLSRELKAAGWRATPPPRKAAGPTAFGEALQQVLST